MDNIKGTGTGAGKTTKTPGPKPKTPKPVKYKNTCKGAFTMLGMIWKSGESLPVSDDIAKTKKFKHAVSLGVLVKK